MQDTLVFINKIREYQAKGLTLEELIDPVIEYCIKNNILKDFLKAHASEVVNMIFGEYNREMDIAVNRREAMEEGMEKEKLIIARNLLEKVVSDTNCVAFACASDKSKCNNCKRYDKKFCRFHFCFSSFINLPHI
ncbi:hypothetical protein [Treponema sp. R6D11]